MVIADKYENDFSILLQKFNELFLQILDNNIDIKSEDCKEHIRELVIMSREFGLHYGLNHRHRRCNSKYIYATEENINLIDLDCTYFNLLKSMIDIQKSIVECKRVFICGGNLAIEQNLSNVLYSNRWIPGTLTNSQHALQKYLFFNKLGINQENSRGQVPFSIVFSLSPKLYGVISKEVLNILNREILFDSGRGKRRSMGIKHMGIVDTNINTEDHTNVINICINSYSRYTKRMISSLLNNLFQSLLRK